MKKFAIAAVLALLTAGPSLAACYEDIGCTDSDSFAKADLRELSCQALWEVRNTIFQENGYCFQTRKAINYFGNDGCWISDQSKVKMSKIERDNVARIVSVENQFGC